MTFRRRLWKLSPKLAVDQSSALPVALRISRHGFALRHPRFDDQGVSCYAPPLLEEEGDAKALALIAQRSHPRGLHQPVTATAFAPCNQPVGMWTPLAKDERTDSGSYEMNRICAGISARIGHRRS